MSIRKLIFPFIILLLFCVALPAGSGDPPGDFIITRDSVGRVKLGQSKQEVFRLYRDRQVKEVDLLLEGLPTPALQIWRGKEILITAELDVDSGTVYRISTTNRQFVTREGIRVGSTLGEAKRRYGVPKYLGWGEGGIYAVFDVKPGRLGFLLDLDLEPRLLEKYPADQSTILKILVVR